MTSITTLFGRATALSCLLAAVACGSADDTGKSQSAASKGACPDEEGAADKVACAADGDCDADELCNSGLCQ